MNLPVFSVLLVGSLCLLFLDCQGLESKCLESSYACQNSTKCISAKYQCDGDNDCPAGDDEEDCDEKVSGCGDESRQYGVKGTISSMEYPSSYYNLADCKWRLQAPDGWRLTLVFDDLFDLEKPRHGRCTYDRVTVFKDDPLVLIGEYCGNESPATIHTNSSKAVVEFTSDRDNVGHGFRISWTAKENLTKTTTSSYRTSSVTLPAQSDFVCPFLVTTGGIIGTIKSPILTPEEFQTSSVTCSWLISVSQGHFISMDFDTFHLSSKFPPIACQDAYLNIYDGPNQSARLIDKLCGWINPGEILSTSNSMFLVLTAPNGLSNDTRFVASYYAGTKQVLTTLGPPPPGCDGNPVLLTSPQGFITSPNFDGVTPYRNFLDCSWLLLGTSGEVFTFSFEDLEVESSSDCRFDFVRIVDNTNGNNNKSSVDFLNTTYCSLRLPPDTESKTANVTVSFHSDDQVAGTGFNMTFKLGPPAVVCSEGQFKCGSEECISDNLVCDGVPSCKDASDELICYNMSSCGIPTIQANLHDVRIVGGTEAMKGAWPWTVSILTPEGKHLCGASLILPQWVITAAHCFDAVYNGRYGRYSVMAGRHELGHQSRNEQRKYIDEVIIPPDYVSSTSQNDIALIKLISPFNISDTINTVCVPEEKVDSGEFGWITGWGQTFATCCAGKLKQATVPVMNHTLCVEYYGDSVYDHMMCAGYPDGGADSCHGDSGGPFVTQRKQDGPWELQGVTSWGELCGLPREPGVYTIVHDFVKWIQQSIASNQA